MTDQESQGEKEQMKESMLCPYSFAVVEQVNQNKYEFDTDGHNVFHEHKMVESRKLAKCAKEGCGAWHEGRCRYRDPNN